MWNNALFLLFCGIVCILLHSVGRNYLIFGPYLWTIKMNNTMKGHLFATIRDVPSSVMWNKLSASVHDAFDDADEIWVERYSDWKRRGELKRECINLPGNKNISEVVSRELYLKLDRFFRWLHKDSGSTITLRDDLDWTRMYPFYLLDVVFSDIGNLLYRVEEALENEDEGNFDNFLFRRAKQMKKGANSIESFSDHCYLNRNLPNFLVNQQLDALVTEFLNDPKETAKTIQENNLSYFLEYYVAGFIIPATRTKVNSRMSTQEKLRTKLFNIIFDNYQTRALEIARKLHKILSEPTRNKKFFAINYNYLLGKTNIVNILRGYGYEIHRVNSIWKQAMMMVYNYTDDY